MGKAHLFFSLILIPAACPWAGAALTLSILALDSKPITNTKLSHPHDYMRLGGVVHTQTITNGEALLM